MANPIMLALYSHPSQEPACLQEFSRYAQRVAEDPRMGLFPTQERMLQYLREEVPVLLDREGLQGPRATSCHPAQLSKVFPKEGMNCWQTTAHMVGWFLRNGVPEDVVEVAVLDTDVKGQRHLFPALRRSDGRWQSLVLQPPMPEGDETDDGAQGWFAQRQKAQALYDRALDTCQPVSRFTLPAGRAQGSAEDARQYGGLTADLLGGLGGAIGGAFGGPQAGSLIAGSLHQVGDLIRGTPAQPAGSPAGAPPAAAPLGTMPMTPARPAAPAMQMPGPAPAMPPMPALVAVAAMPMPAPVAAMPAPVAGPMAPVPPVVPAPPPVLSLVSAPQEAGPPDSGDLGSDGLAQGWYGQWRQSRAQGARGSFDARPMTSFVAAPAPAYALRPASPPPPACSPCVCAAPASAPPVSPAEDYLARKKAAPGGGTAAARSGSDIGTQAGESPAAAFLAMRATTDGGGSTDAGPDTLT